MFTRDGQCLEVIKKRTCTRKFWKGALSGQRQFLATERSLKMMKNALTLNLFLDPFLKEHQSKVLYSLLSLYTKLRAIEIY